MGEDHNGIGVGRKNCRRHRWEQGHRARNGALVTNPPFLSSCTGPAKSAEIRLSRILANEFALQNIRVNCVVPGFVNTPERFAKWERELAKRQLPDEEAEKCASSGRSIRPRAMRRPQDAAA
jgi:3-oxoacyl-[acyl-carrier protein] reductase